MTRKYNFGAGPAALPLPVLERAREELIDFNGNGMSIMEMSHRSKGYDAVHQAALGNVRHLLGVPDDYEILLLQGGATHQFAMIPLNLRRDGETADYINTGSWSTKAIKEARVTGKTNVIWDGADINYSRVPDLEDLQYTSGAAYVHLCSNETIGGVRFNAFPKTDAPLLADMSSEIMSRVIDVSDFGMLYAGAQKNLGPSGLALVIIRKDLLERCPETVPYFWRYKTHAAAGSLSNTPNTWAIYLLKLVTDWIAERGGVAELEKINEAKAAKLYAVLDASEFWRTPADKACRSTMNVVWRLPSEALEAKFVGEATAEGLIGLKGHRSVGGIRASIYNACTSEAIDALIGFMKAFETGNG